jgi:hypothetical protein
MDELNLNSMARSNIYYINDRLDKRTWTYIFGACCATSVFIPSFHNYRVWSFLGLGMTTYTAWYLTIAAAVHGQVSPPRTGSRHPSFIAPIILWIRFARTAGRDELTTVTVLRRSTASRTRARINSCSTSPAPPTSSTLSAAMRSLCEYSKELCNSVCSQYTYILCTFLKFLIHRPVFFVT